jgi:predicted nucleotidyltransferase
LRCDQQIIAADLVSRSFACSPGEKVPTLSATSAVLSLHEAEHRSSRVCHAAIFGRVAQGEATAASDIDVLVELDSEQRVAGAQSV